MERCWRLPVARARLGFGRFVRQEHLQGPLLARARGGCSQPTVPSIPRTDGKAMARRAACPGAARPGIGAVLARGSRMGTMTASQPPTLQQLSQLAPKLQALIAAHGGRDLRVFGSVLHGTAAQHSEVDLLVDVPGSPSFEQCMDLKLAMEDLLNARVDLVTRRGLRPE